MRARLRACVGWSCWRRVVCSSPAVMTWSSRGSRGRRSRGCGSSSRRSSWPTTRGTCWPWVRLNRPLRDNEGSLAIGLTVAACIAVPETTADIPGCCIATTCSRRATPFRSGDVIDGRRSASRWSSAPPRADPEGDAPGPGRPRRPTSTGARCEGWAAPATTARRVAAAAGSRRVTWGHRRPQRHERRLPHGASRHAQRRSLGHARGVTASQTPATRGHRIEPRVPLLRRARGRRPRGRSPACAATARPRLHRRLTFSRRSPSPAGTQGRSEAVGQHGRAHGGRIRRRYRHPARSVTLRAGSDGPQRLSVASSSSRASLCGLRIA